MLPSLIIRRFSRPSVDAMALFRILSKGEKYAALLESVDREHGQQDCSFVAIGARDVRVGLGLGLGLGLGAGKGDPLKQFENFIGNGREQGFLEMGYIGYLSFESARHFEDIQLVPDPTVPDAEFFLPEVLIKIDHARGEVTVTAHEGSKADVDAIVSQIRIGRPPPPLVVRTALPLTHDDILPLRRTSSERYMDMVSKAQEGILAGEIFQVVLSQELRMRSSADPLDIYAQLRTINPSPYMFYFCTPARVVVGASPETLLRVDGRTMVYRPIAGTRKRTGYAKTDEAMQKELLSDPKERAEHQMLVDLGRNDIGRIAEIGSVTLSNPFHIEAYAHVYHLVSDITGRLPDGKTSLDALRSVFPAGTLTGAPKVRAMEVIRDLEQSPRGIYGGAFGYIDHTGNLDFAIAIRTMVCEGGEICLRVGAGIVKDSIPALEDKECLHKARSCLAAVRAAEEALASADSTFSVSA